MRKIPELPAKNQWDFLLFMIYQCTKFEICQANKSNTRHAILKTQKQNKTIQSRHIGLKQTIPTDRALYLLVRLILSGTEFAFRVRRLRAMDECGGQECKCD